MARTYKKNIRQGVCGGTNTEFYQKRNRKVRRENKEICRELVNDDDRDIVLFNDDYRRDDYLEPTDGSYLITDDEIKRDIRSGGNMYKKAMRYFKSMRPWNRSKKNNV